MGEVLTFLGTLEFTQIMVIIIVSFILSLIYRKVTEGEFYSDLQDIKDKKRSQLWTFIRNELHVIEAYSYNNTKKIIECVDDVGDYGSHENMMVIYRMSLERALYQFTFEDIKTAMRENGFHDLDGAALDQYIRDKAESVLAVARKLILERCPFIDGTDEERFSVEDGIKFYRKVVMRAIGNKKEQDAEIKELKMKFSIIEQILKLFPKKNK